MIGDSVDGASNDPNFAHARGCAADRTGTSEEQHACFADDLILRSQWPRLSPHRKGEAYDIRKES
jgi:hypothetical protein